MRRFATVVLADAPSVVAPDGSALRPLLALGGGSMVRFELRPGQVSTAVAHRTVEEIWYVVAGRGRIWRRQLGDDTVAALHTGVCVTVPLGTAFQFRNDGEEILAIIAVTMPPWPGDDEAIAADGFWPS